MTDMSLEQLEDQFGETFVRELRGVIDTGDDPNTIEQFKVGEAKDRFSELLRRAREGSAQVVKNRSEQPVVIISMDSLAELVSSKKGSRFCDLIAANAEHNQSALDRLIAPTHEDGVDPATLGVPDEATVDDLHATRQAHK